MRMLLFAVDDEPRMLRLLHQAVQEAAPEAEVRDFPLGTLAVQALEEGARPAVVFSEIQMPGLNGLGLAVKTRRLSPGTKVVFVTDRPEYALDAYRVHASGYIMKPVDADRVREELEICKPPAPECPGDRLQVRCFGHFEVFWRGRPLMFGRRKTKELLAFLVDREGRACTAEEISAALWEDETDLPTTKARIRQLISDMRGTFQQNGMGDMLVRRSGQLAIRRDRIDCDYYRMLEGDRKSVNAYQGEYMSQYSWAEITSGKLFFRKDR